MYMEKININCNKEIKKIYSKWVDDEIVINFIDKFNSLPKLKFNKIKKDIIVKQSSRYNKILTVKSIYNIDSVLEAIIQNQSLRTQSSEELMTYSYIKNKATYIIERLSSYLFTTINNDEYRSNEAKNNIINAFLIDINIYRDNINNIIELLKYHIEDIDKTSFSLNAILKSIEETQLREKNI